MFRKLKDKNLFLEPDKSKGIISVNEDDYNHPLKNLFNDTSKFQLLDHDSTIRNFSTLQSCLNTIYSHQDIYLIYFIHSQKTNLQ